MRRSLRFELAWRYAAAVALGITLVAAIGYSALQQTLDRQIDATLVSVASIQASSVTADPTGEMRFHEWDLTAAEAASLGTLNRYAQIWSESGQSLLRSRYLTEDLPLKEAPLQEAAAGELAWAEGWLGDTRVRSIYYPLGRLGSSHEPHILEVAAPLTGRDRTLRMAALFLVGIVLLVSAVSFVGSWWLAGNTVRPVNEIVAQAEEIRGEMRGQRITAYAETREFAHMVRGLNTMLERIEEAFEAQRRFTADASHELRSPLTALRGELELALRRERSEAEYRAAIGSALEEATRLSELAADLLTLARSDAGVMTLRLEVVDVAERIALAVEKLDGRLAGKDVTVSTTARGDTKTLCDVKLTDQLVWNLLDNAVKFSPRGANIEASVEGTAAGIAVEVADRGPGIPEEDLERIFERFSRADGAHADEGTGLGLSIVRAIVGAHGGRVQAANREGGGSLFRCFIPRRTESVSEVQT